MYSGICWITAGITDTNVSKRPQKEGMVHTAPPWHLTLTAGSLQVPNPLLKLMMFLAWYSWPYLCVKIMCGWSLVAISTSYSRIPHVYCFLMNSEMVFELARLGWEAQEVLKLFCITLGRKAIECHPLPSCEDQRKSFCFCQSAVKL